MSVPFLYFLSSFLLHLAWENAQAPLFEGFVSFRQHFWICLMAAAMGDMAVMAIIYASLALMHRDILWVSKQQSYARAATWILPAAAGLLAAVFFEMRALREGWWAYTEAMPLVPFSHIGFMPVLQMIVVPVSVMLLCLAFAGRRK